MTMSIEKYDEILALRGENPRYVAKKHKIARSRVYEIWNGTIPRPKPDNTTPKLTVSKVAQYMNWPAPEIPRWSDEPHQ